MQNDSDLPATIFLERNPAGIFINGFLCTATQAIPKWWNTREITKPVFLSCILLEASCFTRIFGVHGQPRGNSDQRQMKSREFRAGIWEISKTTHTHRLVRPREKKEKKRKEKRRSQMSWWRLLGRQKEEDFYLKREPRDKARQAWEARFEGRVRFLRDNKLAGGSRRYDWTLGMRVNLVFEYDHFVLY